MRTLSLTAITLILLPSIAVGELPLPRIRSLLPAGGRRGTTVEITIGGDDLENAESLLIRRPGVESEILPAKSAGDRVVGRLKLSNELPLGPLEVRLVNAWGVSNPRHFWIGRLPETTGREPNEELSGAAPVPMNVLINGAMEQRADTDWYRFPVQAGQRVVIDCFARRLGSRLLAEVTIVGPDGRQIARDWTKEEADPIIPFLAAATGDYFVRIRDLIYDGGPEHYYRLAIHNGPCVVGCDPFATFAGKSTSLRLFGYNLIGEKPDRAGRAEGAALDAVAARATAPPQLDAFPNDVLAWSEHAAFDGFAYRPADVEPLAIGLGSSTPVEEIEPNDTEATATRFAPPADLVGRLDHVGDRDWFRFNAAKGQKLQFRAISATGWAPTDLRLLLRSLPAAATSSLDPSAAPDALEDVAEGMRDTFDVGAPRFSTRSPDPTLTFQAPASGEYFLEVRDEYGASRGDFRSAYRIEVGPPRPDFRLVALPGVGLDVGSTVVHAGGTEAVTLFILRRGGFNGSVELVGESLPPGLQAEPTIVPAGATEGRLILQAAPNSANFTGPIRIVGRGSAEGRTLVHAARAGTIVWPSPGQKRPTLARLTEETVVAVRPGAPYLLTPERPRITVRQGGSAKVELQLHRRTNDFVGPLEKIRLWSPSPGLTSPPCSVPAGESSVAATLTVGATVAPGIYSVVWSGTASAPFARSRSAGAAQQTTDVTLPATPLAVEVTPAR